MLQGLSSAAKVQPHVFAAKSLHFCSSVACSVSQFSVLPVFLAFNFNVGAVRRRLLAGVHSVDVVALFEIHASKVDPNLAWQSLFDDNGGASLDSDGEEPVLSDGKSAMVSGSPCMSTSAMFGCCYYSYFYSTYSPSSSKSSGSLVKRCDCGCFPTYCIIY